ncbi:MAG: carbohydrate-binding protein [Treponema sp.]|jgi:hypothetical protein|nr:carbohydrate-binding protein [Treponema sp.]
MLVIKIIGRETKILEEYVGECFVDVIYRHSYHRGQAIRIETDKAPCFLVIQLDDVMTPALIYLKDESYTFPVPFGEKKISYNPKAFWGRLHRITAREAYEWEIQVKKNLCLNPYDIHENHACYPHAIANVETRNSSMFAAQNAINGNTFNCKHGLWPYESWGINRCPDAEITIEFGREVIIDAIVLWTRADFPHDNWWRQGEFIFSDETTMTVTMEKTHLPHEFTLEPKVTTTLKLGKLIINESDQSPFPALTQIETYGYETHKGG